MKKISSVCSAFLLVFLSVILIPAQTHADSSPIRSKRIVSVMYDDSGSMVGDRWIAASYAMQAFTAMLNKEDTLYISYMSENAPDGNTNDVTRTVDLNNPQKEVDAIRSHIGSGSTPLNALKSAFGALLNSHDSNPNTEYWLVAFTDGDFNDVDTSEVTNLLKTYSETSMPNGSSINIFFMTIANGESDISHYTPSDSGKSNIDIRQARSMSDVTDNIFSIAAEINGRYKLTGNNVSMPDNKTITISADIPLFNIAILTQNSDVKIESIKTESGNSVPIKSNISIKAPGRENPSVNENPGPSDEALKMQGRAVLAGQGSEKLPAGKYTISFSGGISDKDLIVLLEPAVELRIQVYKDGVPVDDAYEIVADESGLSAKATLFEYGSDNEVLPSMMPDGVVFSMSHAENNTEIESSNSLSLDSLTVTSGDNTIYASAMLPGFFNLTAEKSFVAKNPVVLKMEAELYPDGSERIFEEDGPEVVYLSILDGNKTGIKFTLYEDEGKIDVARANQLLSAFNAGLSATFDCHKTEILSDGSFLVYPAKTSFFYNPIIEWIFHHGSQIISAELDGARAEGSLTFRFGENWVWPVVEIILPLYLIWWFLFKKHFPRGTLKYYSGTINDDGDVSYREDGFIRLSWLGGFRSKNIGKLLTLILPTPSKVKCNGYTFIGQNSFVHRNNRDLLVKNVYGKLVSSTSRNPSAAAKQHEAKTDLSDRLFIKDPQTKYLVSFKLE